MIETTGIAGVAATAVDGILRIYSLFDMGKTLIEIYNDEHNTLQRSFIEAFTKAVDNVSELYDNDSIKSFLENCRQIDNVYYCKDLYDYLCKKNNDREIPLNDNDIVDLSNKITEQLNCIVLNDNEYKNLYNVFSYYQLNNISFKLNELDYIIQKFIDLLSNNKELRSDIAEFARAYKERLFMHYVGDICISLSDIFVMPDVKSKYGIANALDAIRDFINNKNQHVFFLEGFGGYGKSSIVSYLAYNYLFNRSSPNIDFLDDRQLVIIRLRDIDSYNIINSITSKLNNIGKLSKNAVLIFDGLDELCLIENRSDGTSISESIISEFVKDNKKAIITSRPTYIKYKELSLAPNIKYLQAEIMAFNEKKRKKFVDLFTLKDNSRPSTIEYIRELNFGDNNFNNIYSSPFLLYLIMSGGIEEEEKNNSWKLLHRIFYKEMFKPIYNPGVRQLSPNDIDEIYQYNCDIAYEMFKTQNKKLNFTYDELSELLSEYNSDTHDFYEYIKKSHGLFSYMRYNNGAVEFVHNHVRDFFLCEKILRTMLEWYENNYSAKKIALELGNLLKHHYFEKQTKVFIKEALKNNYKPITNRCSPEHLPSIFDLFHNAGGMLTYNYFDEVNKQFDVCIKTLSKRVLDNASYIYKIIYFDDEILCINWFSVPIENIDVISMMLNNLDYANLNGAHLNGVNLKGAHLNGAHLSGAHLNNANLEGADLMNADIIGSNLNGANLSKANLTNVDLTLANIKSAKLDGIIR